MAFAEGQASKRVAPVDLLRKTTRALAGPWVDATAKTAVAQYFMFAVQ
jgi:hypothetical protein